MKTRYVLYIDRFIRVIQFIIIIFLLSILKTGTSIYAEETNNPKEKQSPSIKISEQQSKSSNLPDKASDGSIPNSKTKNQDKPKIATSKSTDTLFRMPVSIYALIVSCLSFFISALTFYQNSEKSQIKRNKSSQMRIVAAQSLVLWDQINTIISIQVHKFEYDPYIFPSVQINAKRLEEDLDAAIGMGLLSEIVGDHKNSLALYVAFCQSLSYIINLQDAENQPIEEWTKQHFVMGMIRLIDICINYEPDLIPSNIRSEISKKIDPLVEQSWTYVG